MTYMSNRHTPPASIRRALVFAGLATLGLALVWLSSLRWPTVDDGSGTGLPGEGTTTAQVGSPGEPRESQNATPPPSVAGPEDPLWVQIDEAAVADLPTYAAEWSEEGRALVRIAAIASTSTVWRIGDRLTLPLPQLGETYHPVIDEIDEAVGARALLGLATDADGRQRRCVVTIGPETLFAYIDTPQGSYELVADDRYGWLLPSSSMMAGWDFSKRDYYIAEREGDEGRSQR